MLKKFSVENFKGFQKRFILDFSRPGNYEFNTECVKDGVISKSIIYGINGIGKSNLGLAIFDLIIHLAEKNKEEAKYTNYINFDSEKPFAYFEYEFQFGNDTILYKYSKSDPNSLVEESLSINDTEMIYYDYRERKGFSHFAGSESLTLESNSNNSRVKYVFNTAILKSDNKENAILIKFKDFVESMLLFYSLKNNGFIGFKNERDFLEDVIIKAGKVKDFETFINTQGLHVSLVALDTPEGKKIYFKHKKGYIHFFAECSTGTSSLILLYSWLIYLEKCSFVYIDEFDAFYHYELSEMIVKELKKFTNVQIVVTTHNTDLLNNDLLRPDCYYIICDEKIESLNRLTIKDLRFAHNLQKMFKADAFKGTKID